MEPNERRQHENTLFLTLVALYERVQFDDDARRLAANALNELETITDGRLRPGLEGRLQVSIDQMREMRRCEEVGRGH